MTTFPFIIIVDLWKMVDAYFPNNLSQRALQVTRTATGNRISKVFVLARRNSREMSQKRNLWLPD